MRPERLSHDAAFGIAALMDPEAAAASGENKQAFVQRLKLQMKLHLLLNEHLLVSDGFFFDNPALWDLALEPGFVDLMRTPLFQGGDPALLVHSTSTTDTSVDSLFRAWAQRGKSEYVNSSALRTLWASPSCRRTHVGLNDYFESVPTDKGTFSGYLAHGAYDFAVRESAAQYATAVEDLLHPSTQGEPGIKRLPKPRDRHLWYLNEAESWINLNQELLRRTSREETTRLLHLVDRSREQYEAEGKGLSRTKIANECPTLWATPNVSHQLAVARLRSLSRGTLEETNAADGSFSVAPYRFSAFGAVAKTARVELKEGGEKVEAAPQALLIERLDWVDILSARKRAGVAIRELARARRDSGSSVRDYLRILRNDWRQGLEYGLADKPELFANKPVITPFGATGAVGTVVSLMFGNFAVGGMFAAGLGLTLLWQLLHASSPFDLLVDSLSRGFSETFRGRDDD